MLKTDRLVEVCGLVLPEDTFLAFVQCYVDESGKFHDHQILSLCGFAGTTDQVETLDSGWRSLLRSNGMKSLHMKKAARFSQDLGTRNKARGLENRKTALISFVECARDNMEVAVHVGVDIVAFKSLPADAQAVLGGDAYYLAFQHLLWELLHYYGPSGQVSLVCDDEQYYGQRCHAILAKLKAKYKEYQKGIVSISFADDEVFTALQAADLFAYLVRKEAEVQLRGSQSFQFRPLYHHLTSADTRRKLVILGGVYGEDALRDLARKQTEENKKKLTKRK
jgi:hypothetical protein